MISEIRIYTINRGQLDAFVAAWQAGVRPLRERLGFRIDGAWTIPQRNQFVWILSLDCEDVTAFQAANAAYYASPERGKVDPDPAQWIAQPNEWFISPVSS